MAKNFNNLRKKMSPHAQSRAAAATEKMLNEMALADMRRARKITQEQLAKRLKIGQDAVSKIENRADMYVSTLSDVIRGMGGRLELTARFGAADVRLIKLGRKNRKTG